MSSHVDSEATNEGHAALAICESLLIALHDLKIVTEQDARDILLDAAAAHHAAGGTQAQIERHEAIAKIIERVGTSGNAVPRRTGQPR